MLTEVLPSFVANFLSWWLLIDIRQRISKMFNYCISQFIRTLKVSVWQRVKQTGSLQLTHTHTKHGHFLTDPGGSWRGLLICVVKVIAGLGRIWTFIFIASSCPRSTEICTISVWMCTWWSGSVFSLYRIRRTPGSIQLSHLESWNCFPCLFGI